MRSSNLWAFSMWNGAWKTTFWPMSIERCTDLVPRNINFKICSRVKVAGVKLLRTVLLFCYLLFYWSCLRWIVTHIKQTPTSQKCRNELWSREQTCIFSTSLAQPTTVIPERTSSSAADAPIPTEAPVTRATLPLCPPSGPSQPRDAIQIHVNKRGGGGSGAGGTGSVRERSTGICTITSFDSLMHRARAAFRKMHVNIN